jgi:hypothetical protein
MTFTYIPQDIIEIIGRYADIDARRALGLPPRKLPLYRCQDLAAKLYTCRFCPPAYDPAMPGYFIIAAAQFKEESPLKHGPHFFVIQRVHGKLPYREVRVLDWRQCVEPMKEIIPLPDDNTSPP